MIPTLEFKTIIDKWKTTILNSDKINNFCMEKYSKKPKIIIGMDVEQLVNIDNCPAVCIFPDTKNEGVTQDENTYSLVVGWSILNDTINQDIENVYEMEGWRDSDSFGNIIYQELSVCGNHPISKVEFQLFSGHQPQFPGYFTAEISIQKTLGAELNY